MWSVTSLKVFCKPSCGIPSRFARQSFAYKSCITSYPILSSLWVCSYRFPSVFLGLSVVFLSVLFSWQLLVKALHSRKGHWVLVISVQPLWCGLAFSARQDKGMCPFLLAVLCSWHHWKGLSTEGMLLQGLVPHVCLCHGICSTAGPGEISSFASAVMLNLHPHGGQRASFDISCVGVNFQCEKHLPV